MSHVVLLFLFYVYLPLSTIFVTQSFFGNHNFVSTFSEELRQGLAKSANTIMGWPVDSMYEWIKPTNRPSLRSVTQSDTKKSLQTQAALFYSTKVQFHLLLESTWTKEHMNNSLTW